MMMAIQISILYFCLRRLGCVDINGRIDSVVESGWVKLSGCFFMRTTVFQGDGGAIFYKMDGVSMNISDTTFFNCSSSQYGGGIFFECTNSQCYLEKVCGCKCFSQIRSSFASITIDSSRFNTFNYCTMNYCGSKMVTSMTCMFKMGRIGIFQSNSSNNLGSQSSSFEIFSFNSLTITLITIENNHVEDDGVLIIRDQINTGAMNSCNIVNNSAKSSDHSVQLFSGNNEIINAQYCIFHLNSGVLMNVLKGMIIVSHCIISHNNKIISGINQVYNNSFPYQSTYDIANHVPCLMNPASLHPTLIQTISISPTIQSTNIKTPEITQMETKEATISASLRETPIVTNDNTISATLMMTMTPIETPNETIKNDDHNSKSSVIKIVIY